MGRDPIGACLHQRPVTVLSAHTHGQLADRNPRRPPVTTSILIRPWVSADVISARYPPHDRGGAHALGGLRCRRPHGRPDADHLRRQPRPDSLRSRLCEAVPCLSDPGFVRDDDRPASSLSGRAPTSERRPPSHGRRPHAAPPADGRLRRPPDGWRPDQTRDHPLTQTLPRP